MYEQPYQNKQSCQLVDLISIETKRIADKYNKSFLDCEDIVKITGLGRDNVRVLMQSKAFPVIKIGSRKVVSIINFVSWQVSDKE